MAKINGICMKPGCGEPKDDVYAKCDACRLEPKTRDELIDALTGSARYHDEDYLDHLSEMVKSRQHIQFGGGLYEDATSEINAMDSSWY